MKELEEKIFGLALRNSLIHNGKANPGSVLGSLISQNPEIKKKIKEVKPIIDEIVERVNAMSVEEQMKEAKKRKISLEVESKEERGLPPLPNAEVGRVVTAFPPEPSGYPHLGHAKGALINYLYAKMYKGKFILRFEDTNPKLVKEEFYKIQIDGYRWLGIKWDELVYISDHLETFYKYAEKLIKDGHFYLCSCPVEVMREKRAKGEECIHRNQTPEENMKLWKEMLSGKYNEGEIVVRLKGDLSHKNTAMRDPTMLRILRHAHPRHGDKYFIWPSYDFGTAVSDGHWGVTHRIRSKEFELRAELQNYIQKLLGFKPTIIIEQARFNLKGVPASKREIRKLISEGKIKGWDDPRLSTLAALKRRGFLPEAIRNFLLKMGLSKHESLVEWTALETENRKIIDPISNRYFFVSDPVEIVLDKKFKEAKAPLHPDDPKRGYRIIPVGQKIYVDKKDFEKFRGKEVRLLHLCNVVLDKKSRVTSTNIKDVPKIHWVSDKNVKVKIVMPDASVVDGLAEPDFAKEKTNNIIQFERFGFCRVDSENPRICYFTHK
ncbi:MAG: glutamate--tRNA ligase [Candidatus Aenigmarchaeota archaeon]|nr:glutamate--tRNA ligase [Candidatus Aenigmarchaeota archaeon]